jgi:hypothetical protein
MRFHLKKTAKHILLLLNFPTFTNLETEACFLRTHMCKCACTQAFAHRQLELKGQTLRQSAKKGMRPSWFAAEVAS